MWVKIVPSTLEAENQEPKYCLKYSVESFAIVPFHYWILTIKYALSFFKCTSLFHSVVPFGYFGIVEYILKRITAFYGTKYSIYSQVCQIWKRNKAYEIFSGQRNKFKIPRTKENGYFLLFFRITYLLKNEFLSGNLLVVSRV